MRSDTPSTGRRPRGGQRRPRGSRNGGGSSRRTPREGESRGTRPAQASRTPADTVRTASKPAAKPGFFQRIISLFRGKPEEPGKAYGRVITEADDPSTSNGSGRNGGRHSSRPERASTPAAPREAAETAPAAEAPRPKPARKPELVEVTSPKLYVGNLSFDAAESDLSELFAGAGSVQNSEIICHRETQKSKGFGFVTMTTVEEAVRAVAELHDKEFMGRRLVVSGAKTPDVR
ncbi:MAG TPA: hypothetical protein VNQ90_05540 [Chthoniobacteraceae bacterium]|nr:hypothetical protein [Chthoniobacteraceae bacterium]